MSERSQVVLVTGATSGIGAACAEAFAAAGARLVLTGRNRARGEEVLARIHALGADAKFLPGDLTDSLFCNELIGRAVDRFDRLDVLVNNAGILHRSDAEETSDAVWAETIGLNLTAAFYLSRAAVPIMRSQGGGAIVNIASDWGLVGGDKAVAYCAAKGGLVLLTKAMALDHAREGIRVNAVCPGDTDTPMIDDDLIQQGRDLAEGRAEYEQAIPIGRMVSPAEVAALVVYLASDAAAAITGAAIPVDGGHTAG